MNDLLIEIPVSSVQTNPYQPRKVFSSDEIDELADSIKTIGLLHPPVVRKIDSSTYELIAGERRWRAAQRAGLELIPVLVRQADEEFSAHASLLENLQRVDLNPIETAEALKSLMQKFQLKQDQLAEKIGKKRSTVANYLRLLTLPKIIRDSVSSGTITMGHAKVLLSIDNIDQRNQLFNKIAHEKLTVRQTEDHVQVLSKKKSTTQSHTQNYLSPIINTLQNILGTRVEIEEKKEGGRICIDYFSLDDLNRLLELLGYTEI